MLEPFVEVADWEEAEAHVLAGTLILMRNAGLPIPAMSQENNRSMQLTIWNQRKRLMLKRVMTNLLISRNHMRQVREQCELVDSHLTYLLRHDILIKTRIVIFDLFIKTYLN